MKIILATYNEGKAREIGEILAPIEVVGLRSLGVEIDFDAVEDGDSYEENAMKKARAAAERVSGIVVSDDSGIEADALDGRPGTHAARYGGPGATDSDRCRKMLDEMRDAPDGKRTARYVCVVAARFPDGTEKYFRAECEGEIGRAEQGTGGFGYDPIFMLPGRGVSIAEISIEEKNRISHRGKAFAALKKMLLEECDHERQ